MSSNLKCTSSGQRNAGRKRLAPGWRTYGSAASDPRLHGKAWPTNHGSQKRTGQMKLLEEQSRPSLSTHWPNLVACRPQPSRHRRPADQTPLPSFSGSSERARHSGCPLDGDSAPPGGEAAEACRPPCKNSHKLGWFPPLSARGHNPHAIPLRHNAPRRNVCHGSKSDVRKGWKTNSSVC
jgi:hypothetical protein